MILALAHGDVREQLAQLPDACFDSALTDPPYGLSREPDALEVLRHWLAGDDYQHGGAGFMGKGWDSFVPGPSVWRELLRVLKPGAHVLAFGGTRTIDLQILAMRIAGFEIRDQLVWMYGSGFPKSKNVAAAIDKGEGVIGHRSRAAVTAGVADCSGGRGPDRSVGAYVPEPGTPGAPWQGWGTALKPAHEPIVLARKPFPRGTTVARNVLEHGTGGLNVDGCRIGTDVNTRRTQRGACGFKGDVAGEHATGSDAGGRWPANVILDPEAGELLDAQVGIRKGGHFPAARTPNQIYGGGKGASLEQRGGARSMGDTGGASRFFYCAKASPDEREAGLEGLPKRRRDDGRKTDREVPNLRTSARANTHPTIKPLALLRYLARLITPPGGIVCVPFSGSGSEVAACGLEGFGAIGIEQSAEYVALSQARVGHHCGRPELAAEGRAWLEAAAAARAIGAFLLAVGREPDAARGAA